MSATRARSIWVLIGIVVPLALAASVPAQRNPSGSDRADRQIAGPDSSVPVSISLTSPTTVPAGGDVVLAIFLEPSTPVGATGQLVKLTYDTGGQYLVNRPSHAFADPYQQSTSVILSTDSEAGGSGFMKVTITVQSLDDNHNPYGTSVSVNFWVSY